jgi:hypothetical protein
LEIQDKRASFHNNSVKEMHLMKAAFVKNPLDKVSLSLIIDDSAPLVNANYFWMRDRMIHTGIHQRWEDVPVVTPEFFTREFAEWCGENGVKGKFSVIPCPAALGRIDRGIPLFSEKQLADWLSMCRETIVPNFDITPEMLTHSFVVDLNTLKPLESRIWEQFEWQQLDDLELTIDYITLACKILDNVGMPPEGVTSPGGFGWKSMELYSKAAGIAVREITGNKTPYFFKRIESNDTNIEVPVWHIDRKNETAVGEIIACTGDYTGSWTGYGDVNPNYYITEDLNGGRLPEVIDAGSPCVLCSHWQGFYGMHDKDRRGFEAFKTVVSRLKQRDPHNEYTRWRKVSEITNYACALELADMQMADNKIAFDFPVKAPDITLSIECGKPAKVSVDARPLQKVASKKHLVSDTYCQEEGRILAAFTPAHRSPVLVME